jgi:hypothetical protein
VFARFVIIVSMRSPPLLQFGLDQGDLVVTVTDFRKQGFKLLNVVTL